jgi:hypothetical protein
VVHAELLHKETGVEYYKNGNLFEPEANEKLLWAIFGMPDDVQRIEKKFESVIDTFCGFNKREIDARLNENFKKGCYDFLPAIGFNHSIELRFVLTT